MTKQGNFYEDDENPEDVQRAFDEGEPVVTGNPHVVTPSPWIMSLDVDRLRVGLQASLGTGHEVEQILCEGLRYKRSPGGPDDPNGGGYLIGTETLPDIAALARHRLGRVEQLLAAVLGFEADDNGHFDVGEYDAETLAIAAHQRLYDYREENPQLADFSDQLLRSSLGTPEALRIQAQTPRHVLNKIKARVQELEAVRAAEKTSDDT
jgi:hypothetical protein